MKKPTLGDGRSNSVEIPPISGDQLAFELNLSAEVLDRTKKRMLEAHEISGIVLGNSEFLAGLKAAYTGKTYNLAPSQIALYLPDAAAIPEIEIDPAIAVKAVKTFLSHEIAFFQQLQRTQLQVKPGQKEVRIDVNPMIVNITRNALGCYFSDLRNSKAGAIHYVPEIKGLKTKSLEALNNQLRKKLAAFFTSPELISEWEKFPEWLIICPRTLLNNAFLNKNRRFLHTLVSALEQHLFLRGCATLHFDDVFSKPEYQTVWEAFFKKQCRHNPDGIPASVVAFSKAILTYKGQAIPKKFERYLGYPEPKSSPQILATVIETEARVRPIIKTPEIRFGKPTKMGFLTTETYINLNVGTPPEGLNLHVVVWEKTNSGNRRNPVFYCFTELTNLGVEKPAAKSFAITAFWCDKTTPFSSQKALSVVPDDACCEIYNHTPRPEPPAQSAKPAAEKLKAPYTPKIAKKQNPILQSANKTLAVQLNWQEELALKLMECLEFLDQFFEEPKWISENVVFFRVQGESDCFHFTVQIDPLRFVDPDFEVVEDFLRDEALPQILVWAQAKKEAVAATEKKEQARQEVSAWRQANDFRKAKGKACREALSFLPWEHYQKGFHKNAEGSQTPLFVWDNACVARLYAPKIKHLLAQLDKAGIKTTLHRAELKSPSQRHVVLDRIDLEIPELGIRFGLKINREAGSLIEIFKGEYDENLPIAWRNELAHWAIGTVCLMGILTLPPEKSPLKAGKTDRENDVSHFTFKTERKKPKSSLEAKSSYLNLVTRLNNGKGRIKSMATGRGFDWDGSWADFADAGLTVYQNSFFKEESHRDAGQSEADYDLILNDEHWQKYAVLRLWQTLGMGQKVANLNHRSSVRAYSEKMKKNVVQAWNLLSPAEQVAFAKISSPTDAAAFTFKFGEVPNCNFIRTIITLWQQAGIGLFVQTEPIYVSFESVMQHCQKESVTIIARSQADLDALEELGLPNLKIETRF